MLIFNQKKERKQNISITRQWKEGHSSTGHSCHYPVWQRQYDLTQHLSTIKVTFYHSYKIHAELLKQITNN